MTQTPMQIDEDVNKAQIFISLDLVTGNLSVTHRAPGQCIALGMISMAEQILRSPNPGGVGEQPKAPESKIKIATSIPALPGR